MLPKRSKIKHICFPLIVLLLFIAIFGGSDKYDTPEAAVAENNAQYAMASGFSNDEVEFEFVDAKDNEKFIIKCKAKSEDAKEIYEGIYGSDTVYYAYSDGYGGAYHYAIADSKSEAKEKIDW